MLTIFDISGGELVIYRAAVTPEEYPNVRPMMLQNWAPEDLAMYCGGSYVA